MLELRADADTPCHDKNFTRDKVLILYCASGGRSALAADALASLGYTNIAHLDGGLKAWREAGGAVERPTPVL